MMIERVKNYFFYLNLETKNSSKDEKQIKWNKYKVFFFRDDFVFLFIFENCV